MPKKESGIHIRLILYPILLLLLCLPLFMQLDLLPIRLWDESRLAMNACNMLHNKNYLVTFYNGMPDMWNTKPPLLIWMQVLFMKWMGVNELSVRLPSALAALATCLALILFSKRYIKNKWIGFIAAFVLVCSQGYLGVHAARTGDYDALLTCMTTCSGLFFFLYCEKNRPKDLYLFFLFTTLAVLTKGIAGVLFFPALLLYSLFSKQLTPLLKNKHLYIGSFIFIGTVCAYYLLRESLNHGYIAAVIRNELGARYLNVVEKHHYGYLYYFNNLMDSRFTWWYLFLPAGLLAGLMHKNREIKRITLFSALMALTYILVITLAKTKLEWYDVPMYPFLSLLAAVFIQYMFDLTMTFRWIIQGRWTRFVPYVLIVFLFAIPYTRALSSAFKTTEEAEYKLVYDTGSYFRDALNGKEDVQGESIVYAGYNANVLFYVKLLQERGVKINFKDRSKLEHGDIIIVSQQYMKRFIDKNYSFLTLETKGSIETYKILAKN